MLAAGNRLTDPEGFRAASRRGHRAGARTVVTHLLLPREQQVVGMSGPPPGGQPAARAGFVVSKAVGNAVVRNRVKRRLRHAVRDRIAELAPGSVLVVRALPPAAAASYTELAADLERCLQRVTGHPVERVAEPGEAR